MYRPWCVLLLLLRFLQIHFSESKQVELSQPQFSRRLIFHTSLSGNKRGSGINMILSRWEGLICENDKLGVAGIRFLDVFIRACANSLDAIWRWQSWASWHPPGRTLDANDRTWCTRISFCVWLSKIDLRTVGGCATALYYCVEWKIARFLFTVKSRSGLPYGMRICFLIKRRKWGICL